MQDKRKPCGLTDRCHGASARTRLGVAVMALAVIPPAMAIDLSPDNPDLAIRWDTTVKYSAAYRAQDVSAALVGPANGDDGDRNFGKGLVSNRVDLFTEADIVYNRQFGARISAAAWYDDVYNRTNNNDSPRTANSLSVPNNTFTGATRDLMGQKAELLDAFVFGGVELGDMNATGRLGKHSLLWGESLFFGSNGIAGGQAPVDIIKQLSVPGSQFKEIIRPVNQLSGQLQVNPEMSLGAYYQFEWQPNRIPAAGSYLSASDFLDVGGERFFLGPSSLVRGNDLVAKDSDQYGMQMRFRPVGMDADFGLYAIQYNDKGFQTYIRPSTRSYALAYHEGIRAYGASMSTSVGPANVGVEVSVRDNTPLVNAGVVFAPGFNNSDNPAYPVGSSGHAQASTVLLLSPSALWQGGSLLAEVAWNRLLSISKNPQSLDPNATRDAWGFRVVLAPAYYQVMPGLDITVPIGLGYNPEGRSSVVNQFNGGVDKGGDFSIGVNGEYQKRFRFSVSYTAYIGSEGAYLVAPGNDRLSYQQKYADRNFLSFNLQTSF